MNLQSLLFTALFTLITAGVLAAGTHYMVRPALDLDLTRPDPPAAPAPPEETAERNLQAGSMDRIRDVVLEDFEPRDTARNPFMWPEDEQALLAELDEDPLTEQDHEAEPEAERPTHNLKMVLIGEAGKVALVDREMVYEGDMLGENRVKSIERLQVILATPEEEQITLSMSEPPRMLAFHEPDTPRREREREETPSIPMEDAPMEEKMQYLLQGLAE